MRGQRGRSLKRFATLFAFEQLFYVVRRPTTAQPSENIIPRPSKVKIKVKKQKPVIFLWKAKTKRAISICPLV